MEQDNGRRSPVPSAMRAVFGIFMIIIYVGMGVLTLINVWGWGPGILQWLRWIAGILFIVYGVWRAYRQFKGVDSPV